MHYEKGLIVITDYDILVWNYLCGTAESVYMGRWECKDCLTSLPKS